MSATFIVNLIIYNTCHLTIFCCWLLLPFIFRCYNEFDYSDHIVLFVVQYVFISAIEIAYVLERRSRTRQPLTIASLLGSADALTVIPAAALILLSLRGALFTSMFFHTVAENLTALAVIIVFAFVPLLYFSRSSYWYNMITDIPYLDKE
jgi:hypothetical protein